MLELQILIDPTADRTGFTRRKETRHTFCKTTIPVGFVVQLPAKLTPTGVSNRLGEAVVFEHPANVQVLNLDVTERSGDVVAGLVQEVGALVGYPFVQDRHTSTGLLTAFAAFLATTENALRPLELPFGLAKILRRVNFFAGTESANVLIPTSIPTMPFSGSRSGRSTST